MDRSAVTGAVVVVGPAGIFGGREVDAELVTAAFESADDDVALVEDRVMPADAVWRAVFEAAVEPGTRTMAAVCPTWWPTSRLDTVREAARHVAAEVVLLRRADVLRNSRSQVIVEIAPDFVLVHAAGGLLAVVPRVGDPCPAIAARIGDATAVLIDVPAGLAGATRLGDDLGCMLSRRGMAVSTADDRRVLSAATVECGRRRPKGRRVPRVAASAGAVLVLALAAAAAGYGADDSAAAAPVWLLEGRVAVEVPAGWRVERIEAGPGSVRVQVLSPSDPHVAIHLVQSPGQTSLSAASEVLRVALDEQPAGVFVAFAAADHRAGRDVITYREVRPDHHVDWAVLLDRGVRIAIGCQHAPDRLTPDPLCDQAIRSARTLV